MAIGISDKVDFRAKKTTREKEEHYIIKGSTHQEDKAILIMYAPNKRVSKYMKEKLIEIK